jgi:hypothetical protein
MSYDLIDVTKPSAGNAAAGGGYKYNLVIMLADDVDVDNFPSRGVDLVSIAGDITMKAGKTMHTFYTTPETAKWTGKMVGERDAKGYEFELEAFHPGLNSEIEEWKAKNANENFFIILEECASGTKRLFGSPCSPCTLTAADSESGAKAADKKGTTLKFGYSDSLPPAFYAGALDMGSGA